MINSFIKFPEDDWMDGSWYRDETGEDMQMNTEAETYENPR